MPKKITGNLAFENFRWYRVLILFIISQTTISLELSTGKDTQSQGVAGVCEHTSERVVWGVHASAYVDALGICERGYWLSQGTVEENPKARLYPTRSDLREEEFVLAYNFRRDTSWREGIVPTAWDALPHWSGNSWKTGNRKGHCSGLFILIAIE